MTDVSPCPDCGAAPAWSRCECDFVGVRAKLAHDARIAELEAEVERLKADVERLDWMEAQMQSKNCWLPGYNRHTQTWFVVDESENEPTFRAAIDAARKGGAA